jgi:hypothetical protein
MARVVAFIPDLMFGSRVLGALQSAGHEVVLVGDGEALRRELPESRVLVLDLTYDAPARIELALGERTPQQRTLAFYSHVETDVRAQAERAGLELAVPRSRMAREGPALVDRLLEAS